VPPRHPSPAFHRRVHPITQTYGRFAGFHRFRLTCGIERPKWESGRNPAPGVSKPPIGAVAPDHFRNVKGTGGKAIEKGIPEGLYHLVSETYAELPTIEPMSVPHPRGWRAHRLASHPGSRSANVRSFVFIHIPGCTLIFDVLYTSLGRHSLETPSQCPYTSASPVGALAGPKCLNAPVGFRRLEQQFRRAAPCAPRPFETPSRTGR
jgi:hypothetical protein